ncbi:NAD-P-binding protein [Mycena latifolia]|nr:NAD-P-binding protein [Mycena latifolia]
MSTGLRVWLITGASSGFGRAVTEEVLANGEIAVATLRTPAVLDDLAAANPDRLLVVKCDVTKPDDIISAFAAAIEKFGRVDVVFNNAGYGILAEVEATPEDAARAMFDVNFWGAAAVSKEAVRVFRDVNPGNTGGRLLNVSSTAGLSGLAIAGMYGASKHALEGLTESLRLEMNPAWNIKISIIGSGSFRTPGHTKGALVLERGGLSRATTLVLPAHEAYSGEDMPSQVFRHWFKDGSSVRGDPLLAVKAIFKFSMLDSPPVRWAMGKDAVSGAKAKAALITEETDKFEYLSDNLELPASV